MCEFLLQKHILEHGKIFIGSQGSTVSTHVNYINYINNKPHEHVVISNCNSFDPVALKHRCVNKCSYSWKQKNFMGGHVMSWAMFFPDNLVKQSDYQNTDASVQNENIKLNVNEIINDSTPYLSVDLWISHSDIVIDKPGINVKNELKKMNQEEPILFLKTDLLEKYVDQILDIETKYKLITASNDDHCPPYMSFPPKDTFLKEKVDLLLKSTNLVMWYAKNPSIVHDKLMPYPLGPKWQWKTTRFFGENKTEHYHIYNKYRSDQPKNKDKLLYFNFNQTTNNPFYEPHKSIRHKVKGQLIKNGFEWNASEPFEQYMNTLSQYKFCVAPPGRGIDTHRCWEGLMVGTFPIVVSSPLDVLYKDLPVIVVESFEKITKDFLEEKYEEMITKKYNFDKLYAAFWIHEYDLH
jgi:hypothetical protein